MSISSAYITDAQFSRIISELNLEMDDAAKQDLVDEATGDLEADLCERFVVPLVGAGGGDFTGIPAYSKSKVLNALKSKIRQIVSNDKNRNLVVDSTQRFIDLHKLKYNEDIKDLLDPKRRFGFLLNGDAAGSMEPRQSVGLARADNSLGIEDDPNTSRYW